LCHSRRRIAAGHKKTRWKRVLCGGDQQAGQNSRNGNFSSRKNLNFKISWGSLHYPSFTVLRHS
jgi:hypothetical protein